jgi:hypothetical protein
MAGAPVGERIDAMRNGLLLMRLFPLALLSACGDGEHSPTPGSTATLESFWIAERPAEPSEVRMVREGARSGDEVVVVGRVRAFDPERARFHLADRSLVPCNERADSDCETPWDYCGEDPGELAAGTVIVTLQDGEHPLMAQLRGFHGFDHLAEVVAAGKVLRDASGSVIIVATAVHVTP